MSSNLSNYSYQVYLNETGNGTPIRIAINIMFLGVGILSLILNILAVLAITRIRGSLSVNIRLVCCLVAFDLFVSTAVISDISFRLSYRTMRHDILKSGDDDNKRIIHQSIPQFHPCVSLVFFLIRYSGYNGSLLSLTALATDLYIAIMYPLNYSSFMRKDRVNIIISVIVVLSLLLGCSELYFSFINNTDIPSISNSSYCFDRVHTNSISCFVTFGTVILSIIVVSFVYVSVFYQIKNFHKNGVRCQHHTNNQSPNNNKQKKIVNRETSNTSNMKKNQRGLTTTLVLLLTFVCCFLPSFITEIYLIIHANDEINILRQRDITLTYLFLNLPLISSALDPLLYSYRLKDIQVSYLRIICCHTDNNKPNLPPLLAGRARAHPIVPVYQPIHRRSIACTSPNTNLKQSLPWSQRLANATGIYIERIRKISNHRSSDVTISHKRTPVSAPPFNNQIEYESNNEALLEDEVIDNPCYTVPTDFSMASSNFISAPKMVLCTWNFANQSLRQSWLMEDPKINCNPTKLVLDKRNKFSNYSSSESAVCSCHSVSIDSGNTNSTGTSVSGNQNRSQSFDYCRNKSTNKTKNKIIDFPNQIIE